MVIVFDYLGVYEVVVQGFILLGVFCLGYVIFEVLQEWQLVVQKGLQGRYCVGEKVLSNISI